MHPLPVICLAAAVAAVISACAGGTVFRLEVGDCFQDVPEGEGEVTDVEVVPCDEPHDNEVFHTFELGGDQLPAATDLRDATDAACFGTAFEDYIGQPYATSELEVLWITPTHSSWDVDDREVTCVARVPGGRTEGSLRGSGR